MHRTTYILITFCMTLLMSTWAYSDTQKLGSSSVHMELPDGYQSSPYLKGAQNPTTMSQITVWEEPINIYPMWAHSFASEAAARKVSEQGGSGKFISLFELDMAGQTVPVMERFLKSGKQEARIFEALIKGENAIKLKAFIREDDPITREDIIAAFKTVTLEPGTSIDPFAESYLYFEPVSPFDYFGVEREHAQLMTFPGYDPDDKYPTILIGFEDVYDFDWSLPVGDVNRYIFPAQDLFFGKDQDDPDYMKMEMVSQSDIDIGPGPAHVMEVTYKKQTGIQYSWKVAEDVALVLLATGKTKDLVSLREEVEAVARSLELDED